MLDIAYSKYALRVLTRLPVDQRTLITDKIGQYAIDPGALARQVTKLKSRPGHRLRIGDWRVIFKCEGTGLTILEIGQRGSIY